jgi:hypothetical protein
MRGLLPGGLRCQQKRPGNDGDGASLIDRPS